MGKLLLLITVLVQAGSLFAAGMLFAYGEDHPAALFGAVGGTLTVCAGVAVANLRVVYEKEAD